MVAARFLASVVWIWLCASSPSTAAAQRPKALLLGDGTALLGPVRPAEADATASPIAQTCDDRRFGYARGLTRVAYDASPKGDIDLSTIRADSTDGISPEGAESIMRRILEACRVARSKLPAPRHLVQWVKFHAADSVPPRRVVGYAPEDTGTVAPDIAAMSAADASLEELPYLLDCTAAWGFGYGERFEAILTVDAVGRTVARSVRPLGLNSRRATGLRMILESCLWTPARTHGKRVAVRGRVMIGGK